MPRKNSLGPVTEIEKAQVRALWPARTMREIAREIAMPWRRVALVVRVLQGEDPTLKVGLHGPQAADRIRRGRAASTKWVRERLNHLNGENE